MVENKNFNKSMEATRKLALHLNVEMEKKTYVERQLGRYKAAFC
jgi:hypothetical protein